MQILVDIGLFSTYPFFNKTDPFGNNTSVNLKVDRKPGDKALVDDAKALSQKDTDSVDELIEHSETLNEPIHNV